MGQPIGHSHGSGNHQTGVAREGISSQEQFPVVRRHAGRQRRLLSVDEQFARVTIRYQGDPAHKNIMAYLEREFGKIERIPGQMLRGLNQQYSWRGTDTEINVTYQASTEKGFVFIDSRSLAPRFNDLHGDTVD